MYFNNVTIFKIYNYLNINDLFNCSLVNKQFNNIFNCDLLWNNIITEKYIYVNIDEIKKHYNIIKLKYVYKIIKDLLYLNKTLNLNKTVTDLINLERLNVYSQLKEIPEIGCLINLKWLDLDDIKLQKVPEEIGSLINLQYLFLDNNQLQEIPEEIRSLIDLQYLNLNNNKLKEIPKEIKSLINLHIIKN